MAASRQIKQLGGVYWLGGAELILGRHAVPLAEDEGWTCAKCGQSHQHGRFCTGCGAALLQFRCRCCGAKFPPGTSIPETCATCGEPFSLVPQAVRRRANHR